MLSDVVRFSLGKVMPDKPFGITRLMILFT
uniref:Uncharacterized protein n=1 Tax=Anguilla anguilla TaxID=7936 RepID=A0A0E9W1D0_ANGAN